MPTAHRPTERLTSAEAAAYLHLATREPHKTMERLRTRRENPLPAGSWIHNGVRYLYLRAELDAWLERETYLRRARPRAEIA